MQGEFRWSPGFSRFLGLMSGRHLSMPLTDFTPAGYRNVATGGASPLRAPRNPWKPNSIATSPGGTTEVR
jgi:hypothetical protein